MPRSQQSRKGWAERRSCLLACLGPRRRVSIRVAIWKISLLTSLTFFDSKIPRSWTTDEHAIEQSADVDVPTGREQTGTRLYLGNGGVTVTEV